MDYKNTVSTPSILSALHKLRYLLERQEKIKCIKITGFALVSSLFEMITASFIVVFAQVLNQPEMGQMYLNKLGFIEQLSVNQIIFYLSMAVGCLYLIKNFVAAAEIFYQNFTIQTINYRFKNKLLSYYAKNDYGFYLTRNSSLGMQIVEGDADKIFVCGMLSIAGILSESIVFTGLIAMIIYMNPSLALAIFFIGVIGGLIVTKGLLPLFYKFGQRHQEASVLSYQHLMQFFQAFKEIILLGKRDVFIKEYQQYSYKASRIIAMQTAMNGLPRIIIEVLFVGIFVTTISILCLEHENPVHMMGILGGYLYAGFRLMPGLNRMINMLNAFKSTIPSIERVYDEYKNSRLFEAYINEPKFCFNEKLSFQDVSFSYLNTEKKALSHIAFDIKKGECIGIIGETGSGKSTLVDLLLGLLRPTSGFINVDEIFSVHSYEWHKKIGYVPQSIYLTDNTIAANIAFGEESIDEKRLNDVIEMAQLGPFIEQLPQGHATSVGERGMRLSGGERQRIAIARALYHNPDVLIFDEATSALDNETESRLMETIQGLLENRTVIMIAHRLTTLKKCDRIIVMHAGHIKTITTYDNLTTNIK